MSMTQPNIHTLKLNVDYWEDVRSYRKRFEIRKNDRGFAVGDFLVLKGHSPSCGSYPCDKDLLTKILYMTDYEQKEGYVVLSISRPMPISKTVHTIVSEI